MIEKHTNAVSLVGGGSEGDIIALYFGPNLPSFKNQLMRQKQALRAYWRGLGAIEHKAMRIWNSVAAGKMNEATERRRREALADELLDLLACGSVHLMFCYPDDMPLDGSCQLAYTNPQKKKKPRKSGAKSQSNRRTK